MTKSYSPASDILSGSSETLVLVSERDCRRPHWNKLTVAEETEFSRRNNLRKEQLAALVSLVSTRVDASSVSLPVTVKTYTSFSEFRPGMLSEYVRFELGVSDSVEYDLIFTARVGYGSVKKVRKIRVKMDGVVQRSKLIEVADDIAAFVVQQLNNLVEIAALRSARHNAVQERLAAAKQFLADSGLADKFAPRYGTTLYAGDVFLCESTGEFQFETRGITVKPELLGEFLSLLDRNAAK